jgi:hypothetical protein
MLTAVNSQELSFQRDRVSQVGIDQPAKTRWKLIDLSNDPSG